jgi:magnesium transporter
MNTGHKKVTQKTGLSPGSVIYVGKEKTHNPKIQLIDYDTEKFQEKYIETIEECLPFKDSPTVSWININGIHDTSIIEKVGSYFELHPLVLEDIVNANQRSKIEDFESYIFCVLKMPRTSEKSHKIITEQISIILGKNFVLSFQEKEGDVFEPVRKRIREGKSRIRKSGPDYLGYALIDAIVDNYFVLLETLGEKIEKLQTTLIANPSSKMLNEIHQLKTEMLKLRKSVWPLREVINSLTRSESKLIKKTTTIYLRDVYDHTIQVIDTVETFRDMMAGMLDTYLSSASNKMNQIMKVLTVIATIFIPLTFITGIYGMNFEAMPELSHPLGYPAVLVFMGIIGVLMVIYFRKNQWL